MTAKTNGPWREPLPEFDASRPRTEQGLYRKFNVSRVDGSDGPGGKHHGCAYFVLDRTHDKYAHAALVAYANACAAEYPVMAEELRRPLHEPVDKSSIPQGGRVDKSADSQDQEPAPDADDHSIDRWAGATPLRRPMSQDGWITYEPQVERGAEFITKERIDRTIARLTDWAWLAEYANAGWQLPPKGTDALAMLAGRAAAQLNAQRALIEQQARELAEARHIAAETDLVWRICRKGQNEANERAERAESDLAAARAVIADLCKAMDSRQMEIPTPIMLAARAAIKEPK